MLPGLVVKSIFYRLYTSVITCTVLYVLTGELLMSVGSSIVIEAIKFLGYFIFEVFWHRAALQIGGGGYVGSKKIESLLARKR